LIQEALPTDDGFVLPTVTRLDGDRAALTGENRRALLEGTS
jgi:hypothetical protein